MMLRLLIICMVHSAIMWLPAVAVSRAEVRFGSSNCSALLQSANARDQRNFNAILPTADFWHFFSNRTKAHGDILLVDVDMRSWQMLLNNVAALRASDSKLADNVYAIAYDNNTCGHLIPKGVACYYSSQWNIQLADMYKEQTGREPHNLHVVMMGRMMTTTVALCEGHNVFLSDTDVVFYRDPIQYAFHNVNIMITATPIERKLTSWGGRFFADKPGMFYTLNNGVVFYRSNPLTNAFTLSLAIDVLNGLKNSNDFEQGILQKVFNRLLVNHRLKLQPSSALSDALPIALAVPAFLTLLASVMIVIMGK